MTHETQSGHTLCGENVKNFNLKFAHLSPHVARLFRRNFLPLRWAAPRSGDAANNFAAYIIVCFADRTANLLFCRVEPQMDVFMCVIRRSRGRAAASSEIYICILRMFAHFSFIENAFSSFARRAIEPSAEAPTAAAAPADKKLHALSHCSIVTFGAARVPAAPPLSVARPTTKCKTQIRCQRRRRANHFLFIYLRFFPPDSREKRQRAAADRSPNSEN